jgi:predicted ATPase/DNA-binding SARP family transcriptional activator
MDVRILGPFEVVDGDVPVALGTPKERAVLALLAVNANRVVSIDRLAEELWNGEPPDQAVSALRVYVSHLRKVLPADRLLTKEPGYLLRLDDDELDAARFEAMVEAARAAHDRGDFAGAAGRFDSALALWRGMVLEDVPPTASVAAEAMRLEEARLAAVEDHVAAELAIGRHRTLVAELSALVDEYPLRERLWEHLVLALYRCGRQAEALRAYQRARATLVEELGIEPGPELRTLEAAVLAQDPALNLPGIDTLVPLRRDNLPATTTSFVGRERELDDVATLLEGARLVTLTGVGGVGKSRLALEVARRALPKFADGAWLAELAPITDPSAVVEVVAAALNVTQRQGQTLATSIIDFLRGKQLLLLLDNCEHLLDATARFIDDIVRACPKVVVLATSREGLAVAGERIVAVPSLSVPEEDTTAKDALDVESVRLFVERAGAAKAGFTLTDKNQGAITRLCRRLDGIPLAIELAAARVRSLTPAELADRLDERFRLLAGGPRTAVERHQTLQRAIDWSYDLLYEHERLALNRLAVFAGSFDLAAAEAIIADDQLCADDVVDLLGRLVDKSLVLAEDHDSVTRYRLLETIRQYAQERLEDTGETERFRLLHCRHYVAFATIASDGLRGRDEVAWTARVLVELDNLRGAMMWAAATRDSDLAFTLLNALALQGTAIGYASASWVDHVMSYCTDTEHRLYPTVLALSGWAAMTRGDGREGVAIVNDALRHASALDDRDMCVLLYIANGVLSSTGTWDRVPELTQRWVTLARMTGDDYHLAHALSTSCVTILGSRETEIQAHPILEEALSVAHRSGSPTAIIWPTEMLGILLTEREPDRAAELLDEALVAAKSVGNVLGIGVGGSNLARVEAIRGDWPRAAALLVQAVEHMHRIGDRFALRANVADVVVNTFGAAKIHEAVAVVYGSSSAVGSSTIDHQRDGYKAAIAEAREALGDTTFNQLVEHGRHIDDDDLVAFVRCEAEKLLNL